jgi:ABC-type branched-subunit amino acid transport system ATPase component
LAVELSYGQQKLLALARLLAADMDVLLLDEPSAGLNPRAVRRILEAIRRVAGEGKIVVVIEHNMNVVSECVDLAFFVNEGRVESAGVPNFVLDGARMKTAFLGI